MNIFLVAGKKQSAPGVNTEAQVVEYLHDWPGSWDGLHFYQICRWQQMGWNDWHTKQSNFNPERPWETWGLGQQKPINFSTEEMQGSVPGVEWSMRYRLGTDCLRKSPAKKDLDILVDTKLNMSQQCILILKKVNHTLEFLRVNVASRFEGSYSPLLGTSKDTHGLLCVGLAACFKNNVE